MFYNKRKWRVIRDYCIGWTLSFIFLAIVRGMGTIEQGSLKFDFNSSIKIVFTLGPIMGLLSGITQVWMEEKIFKRIPILRFLALRLVYATIFLLLLMLVSFAIYRFYFGTGFDMMSFLFQKGSFAVYFYVLSVDLLINIIRQFNLMIGSGNLSKLLMGKFYHPREETRIFMILDLKSSTQLAEKLGHKVYSSLIQDCFNDLGVVVEDGAEIYQYVGDEAVLTWNLSKVMEDNFLKAFFRFKHQLDQRGEYYQTKYGVNPFFKAGIHVGKVMVTEIGKYKKEIAYHGDTINTAARIQGQCNNLGAELLISESLKNLIKSNHYQLDNVGSILLRGKQKKVNIYSVSE